MEIATLTAEELAERPSTGDHLLVEKAGHYSPPYMSLAGDIAALDIRDSDWPGGRPWPRRRRSSGQLAGVTRLLK